MLCQCPKLKFPDCSDACLVPGPGLLSGFSSSNIKFDSTAAHDYIATATQHMVDHGQGEGYFQRVDDFRSGVHGVHTSRHLAEAAPANILKDQIEIECGEHCVEIAAILKKPQFTSKLSEATGGEAVVNKGSIVTFPTAASLTVTPEEKQAAVAAAAAGGNDELKKFKDATITLGVFFGLTLIALVALLVKMQSMQPSTQYSKGDAVSGSQLEGALEDAADGQYTV
jgi:hypothetical protein